jgi:poly [ADP-ribose] polymerase
VERSYEADSEDDEEKQAIAQGQNGYDRQSRSVSPAKSMLSVPVQNLMRLIFNQEYMNDAMTALNYDADKMPLGKLSKATINRGFQMLKDLAALLNGAVSSTDDIEFLSNTYYSVRV